ncbi:alpha/beta hydrolase-fold protein [Streptomyces sp. NPDC096351]|uniref:alpha/beta hydrolase-fold protein n=1 Tax=Streptomyces sp. NPDC096351 TaxID=3366087 RepID=UPI003819640C
MGGISFGGTCSLQLATNAPEVYGNFLDMSGQAEPTLGNRQETVKRAFGGNPAAFADVNPLDLMHRRTFRTTAGVFVAGSSDSDYLPQQRSAYEASRTAGMHTAWKELPGGHNWGVWKRALSEELSWLSRQTGITPSGTR